MRTFADLFQRPAVYGEVRGEAVQHSRETYWLELEFTGEVVPLRELQIDLPVARASSWRSAGITPTTSRR